MFNSYKKNPETILQRACFFLPQFISLIPFCFHADRGVESFLATVHDCVLIVILMTDCDILSCLPPVLSPTPQPFVLFDVCGQNVALWASFAIVRWIKWGNIFLPQLLLVWRSMLNLKNHNCLEAEKNSLHFTTLICVTKTKPVHRKSTRTSFYHLMNLKRHVTLLHCFIPFII